MDIKSFTKGQTENPFEGQSPEDILSFLEDTKNQLNEARKAAILPMLTSLFKEYGDQCDFVVVRGTTPSFNDGDPCVHRQYVIELDDEVEKYAERSKLFEGVDLSTLKVVENCSYYGRSKSFSRQKVQEFMTQNHPGYLEAFRKIDRTLSKMEDLFYAEYDSHWELYISWDGEKVTIDKDEYYEGY